MNELEKRAAGMLFDANYNPEILNDLNRCKDQCFQYNQIQPSHIEERNHFLKELFGHVKSIQCVQSPFWCDFGYNIEVGENFYANHGLIILDGAKVVFGDNVFIGPNCGFHTAGHPIDAKRRNLGLEYAHPITVGNNVWFGAGVQVMPGISIGDNVVIGAGSIVTKNIPSDVIAVGNPCKVLRAITENDCEKVFGFKK
ncbi:MAG: sugar O-acetyltransferase [Erysipelotrichaceae bacterium]